MSFDTWFVLQRLSLITSVSPMQDINNKKLFIIDLAQGPESVKIIDTKMPIGVTANIQGVDSSEVILAGAKDGVTKFNLKTGEHQYVVKYWNGPDAEDKTRR